jgi:cytochrome o ubiquinol oxidase operon protein cyoD
MPTYKSYITGFVLSIILTLSAYMTVTRHVQSGVAIILGLALFQFIIQIFFFLHIHKGSDRGSNIAIFLSTLAIVIILIGGSLWIMKNLNYNMTPAQINEYMYNQG